MPAKLKFPPKTKKKSSAAKARETADEYQQAADQEESTGGKWRAGDKAKSSRAFLRAIDIYNEGLIQFPHNFDLAYNKARLEFDVSEQPSLVAKLPISKHEFLQQALESHRYALRLNEENTDILFNTAQLLITLADDIVDETPSKELDQALPIGWLREALELLDGCFSRQQLLCEEQAQAWNDTEMEAEATEGGVSLSAENAQAATSSGDSDMGDEATVQAAITATDLIDTLRSSVSAMTQLVSLNDQNTLQTIRAMADAVFDQRLPYCESLLDQSDRPSATQETLLQRCSFHVAEAAAIYDTSQTPDSASYFQSLSAFEELDLQTSTEAMCTYADALVEYTSTVLPDRETSSAKSPHRSVPPIIDILEEARNLYDRAMSILTSSSSHAKAPSLSISLTPTFDPETETRIAAIRESQGDLQLIRTRTAHMHEVRDLNRGHPVESEVDTILLQAPEAAKQFYDQAVKGYERIGDERAAVKARVRALLANREGLRHRERRRDENLKADKAVVDRALREVGDQARIVVEIMVDEGILEASWQEQ